jgi:DNA-binding MarR family transcriptional regulator
MPETESPAENAALGIQETTVSLQAMLDENGSDARFRQFIHDLLSVSAQMQAVRAAIGKLIGLTGVQYTVLASVLHLKRLGEAVTVSRLAEHLHVSGTFITAETRKLTALGLIEKAANPVDGRSVLLRLTQLGEAKLQEVRPTVRRLNDEIFRNFDRVGFETVAPRIADLADTFGDALALTEQLDRKRRRRAHE